ncbi:MAG: imidazole glycerol phosphate synthase subunit HisH [Dehalococcoidia bacterium]|nr:imidazole glycerol phosphate synthase subunit HisH [Dehalococcoidia bacterium]|tara:strand:+ start:1533 stop:2156 length:624 start_codon:yes stop_codon:yes gene_type:complete
MPKKQVMIVDYGAGNVRSVGKAVEKLGYAAKLSDDPDDISNAKAIIFPGQGASEPALSKLKDRGIIDPLKNAIRSNTPFFGVCLGLQLILESSEEGPSPCLGIVKGDVKLLPSSVKRPHMGWNQVDISTQHPVFNGIENMSYFYFVHSYYANPSDEHISIGHTDYGIRFCSVIAKDELIATQFHPEKSGSLGLRLYDNFLRMSLGNP